MKRRWEAREGSSISHWTWSRSRGLRVHYRDGMVCKSDWGSLRNFLAAIARGMEFAREVTVVKGSAHAAIARAEGKSK